MRIEDFEYIVPKPAKCRVFTIRYLWTGEPGIYKKEKCDLFYDYPSGIEFADLKRYRFVWHDSRVSRVEAISNELHFIVDLNYYNK